MAFKNNYTFICDQVRQEISLKYLIVGLYTGPIGVPQIPIPLGLTFLHFLEADRPGRFTVKVRVEHLETGRRMFEGGGQINVVAPGMVVAPMPAAFQADKEGAYNFILEIESEREPIITPFNVVIARPMPMPGMMPGMLPGMSGMR